MLTSNQIAEWSRRCTNRQTHSSLSYEYARLRRRRPCNTPRPPEDKNTTPVLQQARTNNITAQTCARPHDGAHAHGTQNNPDYAYRYGNGVLHQDSIFVINDRLTHSEASMRRSNLKPCNDDLLVPVRVRLTLVRSSSHIPLHAMMIVQRSRASLPAPTGTEATVGR